MDRVQSPKQETPIARVNRAFVAVAAIFATAAFAFIETASEVREGETLALDNQILMAFRHADNLSIPNGPHWLQPTFLDISALGGVAVLAVFTVIASGYCLLIRRPKLLLFFLGSMGGGTVAMMAMKTFFSRPRPSVVPHLAPVSLESFPSGHSMSAAIFYFTLSALLAQSTTSRRLKLYYFSCAVVIALLVGLSRVYLGVHYPTDVLAGWCAGIAWASASYLIADWLQRTGKVEQEAPAPPSADG